MRNDEKDPGGTPFTGRLGLWKRDLHTGAMQWGNDVDEIFGFPHGGATPSLATMLGAVVPEERDRVRAALEQNEQCHVEYRVLRPDGREVVVRNEWSAGPDEAGRPVIQGVILDVTPRKRDKASLQRKTNLLELLYDVAACANEAETIEQVLDASIARICTFDGWAFGHVLLVSDGEPRELVPSGVCYAESPRVFEALRAAALGTRLPAGTGAAGAVVRARKPAWFSEIRGQGHLATAAAAAAVGLRACFDLPVLVGSEAVAVIECFAYDDHPPDQDLLQAMTNVAAQIGRVFERRKVDRLKDEFVSVVSHELRTPLTSIQGAIGLLESGVLGPLPDEALEMIRIARDGCGRLLRLVNELLDLQKLEYGTPKLHVERLVLAPILEGAVAASRPHAAALGVRLLLDDLAPGARVIADGDRLAQVLSNLLSNAIKYTPRGERILVRASRERDLVRVTVEDRGPGVPEEFRRSLFQKFSQADASDARQKGGTGLGLAICKMIVERLDGSIAHENVAGGGARFYFELPELPAVSMGETANPLVPAGQPPKPPAQPA